MHNTKLKTVANQLLLCLLTFTSLNAYSQERKASQQTTNKSTTVENTSLLGKNLENIGAFSCAERANQISNFLSPNGQHELILQTPKDNVNNRLLMSSMLIKANKDNHVFASVALAPNQINGCGGSYRTIFYSSNTCTKASAANFPKDKFQKVGGSKVQIAVINRALWVIAMPADKGCIFIKEEIIE